MVGKKKHKHNLLFQLGVVSVVLGFMMFLFFGEIHVCDEENKVCESVG